MTDKNYNVLFLCTGNSARSILAEALLQHWGLGRFKAYSAGSRPKGEIHPMALEILRQHRHFVSDLRSKSWDEFAADDAPEMDFVFTVCDNAAGETCPVWPGQPMTAHWGIEDPDREYSGPEEERRGFLKAYYELDARIKIFTSLPLAGLDKLSLQNRLDEIGSIDSGKHVPDDVH